MTEIASAFVSLAPTVDKGFGRKLESEVSGEVKGSGKRLGTSFGKMFAFAGGLLAAAGVGSFLKDSIGEAREAQKVGALTESIIKSTGGAAKVTAGQVGQLASAISLKTGMDDEAIQSGANMLLTFKNVRNEVGKGSNVFDRATQAATDLSAAGFGDMAGQSKMLGKALNDPIKGISALGRSGVTFTEQQKTQIKALVESGQTLKAQKIILGEVESQVGGAAAASATAGEKASVAFGNLKEDIGTALLPAVDAVANGFLRVAPSISKGIGQIGPLFSRARSAVAPFVAQVQGFFGGSGGSAIASFGAVIKANLMPVLQTAATTFQTVILPAITSLVSYVASSLFPVLQQVAGIISSRVLPILSSLAQFFYGSVYPAVVGVATAVAQNLRPVFDALVAQLQGRILPTVDRLLAAFQKYQPTIQKVIGVVVRVVGKVLEFAAAILGKVLPVAIRFQGFLTGALVGAVIKVVGAVVKVIGKIIDFGGQVIGAVRKVAEFQRAVGERIARVVKVFTDLPGKIKGAFGDAGGILKDIGGQIVDGLKRGIESTWHKVTDVVDSLIKKIPKKVRDIMGIKSPSTVMAEIGRFIMAGLTVGIDQGAPAVERTSARVANSIKKVLAKGADKKFVRSLSDNLIIDWAHVVGARGKKGEKALDQMRERLSRALDRMKSGLQKQIDKVKSTLDSMTAFASSVSSAFKVDLFSGTLSDFFKNGMTNNATLQAVIAGFKKLVAGGWDKGFLSQLIQTGNSGLILELAAADPGTVAQAQGVFDLQNSLTSELGTIGAEFNSGQSFAGVEARLDKLIERDRDLPDRIGKAVGKALNTTASKGKRGQRKDKK